MSGTTSPLRARQATGDLARAIHAAQGHLFAIQKPDGHWCGELEGDTILESEYILAMHFVGRTEDPKVAKAANYIRRKQIPEGGWAIYPGGPTDVSASAKAYFVLKLLGDDPEAPHMVRAREAIRAAGGLHACNSFTKIYLAIFGQYDWARCPSVPPEIILLPRWFYINLYELSSWSRAIVVPLSIVSALKPRCPVPAHADISELVVDGQRPVERSLWSSLFLGLDRGIKLLEKLPIKVTRQAALHRAEQWILERLGFSDGLGAIFPPIVNCIFALHALGYSFEHPVVKGQIRELEKLEIEDGDELRVQPCFSPVWDTALATNALVESGVRPDHPALLRAAEWLLDRRGHGSGDWRVKNKAARIPGWYFEYANPFYPDCDTTAQTIIALQKLRYPEQVRERFERAIHEAHRWHLSMQNRDGGWGAFDRGCDKSVLTHVPFADHNAMIDPSTADLTARALEKLACLGYDRTFEPARRAIDFLLREQEEDGSWFGRWGCNYVYGTWLAAWALVAIGESAEAPWGVKAARWLLGCQNEDGGWGELPLSYEDPTQKGRGPSTACQTAWALMGLMALGHTETEAVRRGVDFLIREQHEDGSWKDESWTGTGFPCVFYLRYHLYSVYFPLLALGHYADGGSRLRRSREKPAARETEAAPRERERSA